MSEILTRVDEGDSLSRLEKEIKRCHLAIAWDEWLASEEGQQCTDDTAQGMYLVDRLHSAFDAGAKAQSLTICKWLEGTGTEETVYFTSCGKAYQFEEGGPEENRAKFCQYCGGKLVVKEQE